jgi:hypothetical protein
VEFAFVLADQDFAASADKLVAARLLHPPSGGSGVVSATPFFCLKFSCPPAVSKQIQTPYQS